MRHMKTAERPAQKYEVLDRITCDLCGAVIKPRRGNAEEVTVKHRTGSSYPEGGAGTDLSVDLCGDCFDQRLVPWLASQGATARATEWDF